MKRKIIVFASIVLTMFFVGVAGAAPVNQVSYGSLTGTEVIEFEDVSEANYDSIFVSGGVGFAERFVGQSLTYSGDFDVLSGSPVAPLALQVGAANQNNSILYGYYGGKNGNVLTGLGNLGYPNYDAIGEGSFALMFSTDQSEFGFSLIGGNGGNAYLSFFRRDGSLISTMTISGLAESLYGFSREGGIKDVAGISVYNNDPAGIGIDDVKHDVTSNYNPVPEPGTLLLLGLGLMGLVSVRRFKK